MSFLFWNFTHSHIEFFLEMNKKYSTKKVFKHFENLRFFYVKSNNLDINATAKGQKSHSKSKIA